MSAFKHGHAKTDTRPASPTYDCWSAMRARCATPTHRHYAEYGGRGITVCERWVNSFENFLADMGNKPPGLTLERRDNDKGYGPDNCKWAPQSEQNRNRSITKLTADDVQEIHGRIEHGEKQRVVAERFGLSHQHVSDIRSGKKWPDQVRGPILFVLLVALLACGASARTKALRVGLVSLNAARDSTLAVSKAREELIVEGCLTATPPCTKAEVTAKVAEWRVHVDAVFDALDVAYHAVHDAWILNDSPSASAASTKVGKALAQAKELVKP